MCGEGGREGGGGVIWLTDEFDRWDGSRFTTWAELRLGNLGLYGV